jgi:hypothetical protein
MLVTVSVAGLQPMQLELSEVVRASLPEVATTVVGLVASLAPA